MQKNLCSITYLFGYE